MDCVLYQTSLRSREGNVRIMLSLAQSEHDLQGAHGALCEVAGLILKSWVIVVVPLRTKHTSLVTGASHSLQ